MNKKIILSVALVAVAATAYFIWPRQSDTTQPVAGPKQRVEPVRRGNLTALVSATGRVDPMEKVEVKSKASGLIIALPIEEGQIVQKGALLAHIDETDARNAYEQAVADLEVAKATVQQTANTVKRQEELFKRGLLSDAEMDQIKLEEVKAKAQSVKAEAELANMETRLKDTVVRAPIGGIVLQKNVEAGQIISSGTSSVTGGTLIATVADMDSVYVFAEVDEVDIGTVQIGQSARVAPDAFPDEIFVGTVRRIAPLATIEQNVTTFNVTVVVHNRDSKLKAGMNATVDLTVSDRQNVLLIPKEAVKDLGEIRAYLASTGADGAAEPNGGSAPDSARARMAQRNDRGTRSGTGMGGRNTEGADGSVARAPSRRKFVVVQNGDGVAPRPIEIGASNFDEAEVLSGLEEGEKVLVFSVSRADAERQRMMNRMRNVGGFSGFGGQRQGTTR